MSVATRRTLYFALAAVIVLLDRLSKLAVARAIELNFGSLTIIPNFFSLTHVENTGAAFSLFANWPARIRIPLLVGFSVAAMLIVGYLLWQAARQSTRLSLALALILGGAAGNLYDRLVRGRVTDFLHVYVGAHCWPDFNLADSAICCGAVLLALDLLFAPAKDA